MSKLHGPKDKRQWCLVFEGEDSDMRSATAAMILSMNKRGDFMLHEWEPKAMTPTRLEEKESAL